jgi:hypothetical protein
VSPFLSWARQLEITCVVNLDDHPGDSQFPGQVHTLERSNASSSSIQQLSDLRVAGAASTAIIDLAHSAGNPDVDKEAVGHKQEPSHHPGQPACQSYKEEVHQGRANDDGYTLWVG